MSGPDARIAERVEQLELEMRTHNAWNGELENKCQNLMLRVETLEGQRFTNADRCAVSSIIHTLDKVRERLTALERAAGAGAEARTLFGMNVIGDPSMPPNVIELRSRDMIVRAHVQNPEATPAAERAARYVVKMYDGNTWRVFDNDDEYNVARCDYWQDGDTNRADAERIAAALNAPRSAP